MTGDRYIVDDRERSTFRVNRTTMTDSAILKEEKSRIFDRSWLYVGHESELSTPNEFRARSVGGRPMIFVRDQKGTIRIFFNVCSHRGTVLCREAHGNSRFLQCFYHAWSYDTSGSLISLPGEDAYGDGFDRSALALQSPAHVDSYQGFYFLNFQPDAPSLYSYLGGARQYLDLVADQGIDGGMEILRGTHEYTINTNWKLLVENSYDAYHVAPTHRRYLKMTSEAGAAGLARAPGERAITAGIDLGGGHAVLATARDPFRLGRPIVGERAENAADSWRSRLEASYGPAWVDRMYGIRNLVIFPSLVVIDLVGGIIVRTLHPTAVDEVQVTAWELAPVGEDPALRSARLDNFLTFWGPAGFATPDDVEALECIQRAFGAADQVPWSDVSRGMGSDRSRHSDELQMRVFWRKWNEMMTGEVAPSEPHLVPEAFLAGHSPAEKRA